MSNSKRSARAHQRIARRAERLALRAAHRVGAGSHARLAGALVASAVVSIELLVRLAVPFAAASSLLVLATTAGAYGRTKRESRPLIAAATGYLVLRMALAGYPPYHPAVITLALCTGLLGPALMRQVDSGARRTERSVRRSLSTVETEARTTLSQLEEENRLALDALEALVWEAQPGSDTLTFLNTFARKLLGYDVGAGSTGTRVESSWDVIHPDDAPRVARTLQAIAADGQARQMEYRIRAKDGFAVWVRDSVSLIPGRNGGTPRLRGTAVDISSRKRIEEDLHREKERYRSLFEGVPVGLYRMTPQGEFIAANDALVQMMGHANHQSFYATSADDIYAEPTDRWRWQNAMVHVQGVRSFELPYRRADGTMIWVRNTARAVRGENDEIAYYEGVVEDITDRKRAQAAEEGAEAKFRGLVEQSLVGIFMVQGDQLVYVNPKMTEIFGYTLEELRELPSAMTLISDEHRSKVAEYLAEQLETASDGPLGFRGVRKEGTLVEVEVHCTHATYNDEPAVLGTLLDITARKEAEERLFEAAFHDPLTGLPNRILFMERLEHAFKRQKRGKEFAVLFLDLNRFKVVNDSLGHGAGDELLRLVAERIEGCLRPGDSVARFGGDEFAILLEDVTELADATHIAERVREVISTPATLGGHEVHPGTSIGIAMSSAGYRKPEEILRDADMAMYRAKGSGLSAYEVFDQAMHGEALDRLTLESDLHNAVERGDFHLHYQPIISLETGEMEGIEALVRWTHSERGSISPTTFIPLAEDVGAIIPIGRLVLRMACEQVAEWQRRFPRDNPLSVSVNLSAKQVQGSALIEDVRQVLEETGIEPASLKLEITESLILEDRRAAAHMLKRLKALGVRIFLDDFGTGYSSLGYLHSLPIDTLKIDRAFVNRLENEDSDSHLVRTIVSVAHNLGMDVVAEGAETEEHVRRLRELGCEFAQGFHFAPPGPAEAIDAMLERGAFQLPGSYEQRLKVVNRG